MADEARSPWWKSGLFAAVLGLAIPGATFVQGWLQKDRELALQEKQQLQQFRAQYMSMVAEAGVEGMEVLADFIADTEQDPTIREWASKQRDKARAKIADLDGRIETEQKTAQAAEEATSAAEKKAKDAESKLAKVAAQATQDRDKREEAEREADAAQRELAKAQASAASSQGKLFRSHAALTGRNAANAAITQMPAAAGPAPRTIPAVRLGPRRSVEPADHP
jgi:DNA-directed RNA polymerase beta' subunit